MGQGHGAPCCVSRSDREHTDRSATGAHRHPGDGADNLVRRQPGRNCCGGQEPREPAAVSALSHRNGDEQGPLDSIKGHHGAPPSETGQGDCSRGNCGTSTLCGDRRERDVFSEDGGTGGTGNAGRCMGGKPRDRFDPCCNLECVADRNAQYAPNQVIIGEKPLQPRLLRHKTLCDEAEALKKQRSKLAVRLAGASVGTASSPPEFESEASGNAVCLSEWVHRLLQFDEALRGASVNVVSEACKNVLGSRSLVELQDIKMHYGEILRAVDKIQETRLDAIRAEMTKLNNEVDELEDLIALCFDKMDEDGEGCITCRQFIKFVSGEGDENLENQCVLVANPKDAKHLFNQMSKGNPTVTYDQFKDEITHGCLKVLLANIDLRRALKQRYRDWWF